ncbi:MAG: methyltransferase domain-containing protein [Candidatus Aenigmatarchaeota archaeon]
MNVLDILAKVKRMPQVVLPKDAALIVAYTGVSPGWDVLDAGTGSAFLSIFLANLVKPGKVVSYEKNKQYAENALRHAKEFEIRNLEIINQDILKADIKEKFDLITLDMKGANAAVKKLDKNLKACGYFAVYSPHIEQVKLVRSALENLDYKVITLENIVREWKVTSKFTHPLPTGIIHTGFITIGRKPKA